MDVNPYRSDEPIPAQAVEQLEREGADLVASMERRRRWLDRLFWAIVVSAGLNAFMNVETFRLWRRQKAAVAAEEQKLDQIAEGLRLVQGERHMLQFTLDVVRRKLLDGQALIDPEEWKQFGGVLVTPLEPRRLEPADQKPTLLPPPIDIPPELK